MKHNIILVDDHKMFLDGLLSIFNKEEAYNILLTANSGENVIKFIDTNPNEQIDIVVSDISMPDIDGITLNDYIKKTRPEIKTLIVSMHTDTGMIDTLIKSDVDGYLSKNATQSELLLAVKTILSNDKYFSESVKQAYMNNVFNKGKDTMVTLTKREKDVLKLIAEEYTTQEIADKLFLSKHTIESYRKNLISKLNVKNLAGLTKYAIKLGLVE
ncbi:LuxR family two component transcriptional regulator [Tenacibaculum lutimaris]|uniref:LuxR family two component transcriptional regulator n=1 Tax=Tenacibaculum lutimaris TaxID=285258 RepID=A0A420DYY0_9FLAO|nr:MULTISPECIES: response regulator transcription factor [Tenacibaculum]RKF03030.1 LuxR family two component transcriptional regulator [Tenacibaculum lutimaris]